jgi:hypothetical protein
MQQETEQELARLLQGYFSKETAVKILGTMPDDTESLAMEQKIGGVALYPVGAVAKKLIENRMRQLKTGNLAALAEALAEKYSGS